MAMVWWPRLRSDGGCYSDCECMEDVGDDDDDHKDHARLGSACCRTTSTATSDGPDCSGGCDDKWNPGEIARAMTAARRGGMRHRDVRRPWMPRRTATAGRPGTPGRTTGGRAGFGGRHR